MRIEISNIALITLRKHPLYLFEELNWTLFLLLCLPLGHLLLYSEATHSTNVSSLVQTEKYVCLFLVFIECASDSSKKLPPNKFVNANELFFFDPKEFDSSIVKLSWQDNNAILINFLNDRLIGRRWDAWVLNLP